MDPQIIIVAHSFQTAWEVFFFFRLAWKKQAPHLCWVSLLFYFSRKWLHIPPLLIFFCSSFSPHFLSSHFSRPSQLCVLPQAKRSSSDQLWPVILQRKPQHFPLSSHYSLRVHRQACKSMMKRCSNTPQRDLETIVAAGGACLCECEVFWSKVIVPRRRVSWQSNRKSREIIRDWSL